jgi:5-formyltetrahydrofolate cyclo-ligase
MKEIIEHKNNLRRQMRMHNRLLSADAKNTESERIWQRMLLFPAFSSARTILFYWSMDTEVSTANIIARLFLSKKILLPVVQGDNLVLREFRGIENMVAEPIFGILEPQGQNYVNYSDIDFVVVPGLAFDRTGNRLGRGKGYYDKLFSLVPKATKVSVCFQHQLVNNVPVETHDVQLDAVCTPAELYLCR